MNSNVEVEVKPEAPSVVAESVAAAAARVLGEFLKADPEGCLDLLERRIATTPGVVNHPTIQTAGTDANPKVGMLGVINGILEAACGYRVVVHFDGEKIVGFSHIAGITYDQQTKS